MEDQRVGEAEDYSSVSGLHNQQGNLNEGAEKQSRGSGLGEKIRGWVSDAGSL